MIFADDSCVIIQDENSKVEYFPSREIRKVFPMASVMIENHKDSYHLYSFGVNKEYRRKGYASRILQYIIRKSNKPITLDVVWDNIPAQEFYKKFGFRYHPDVDFSRYAWRMIYTK